VGAGDSGFHLVREETFMLFKRFRSRRALVLGLTIAGFVLAAPRHAWAQG